MRRSPRVTSQVRAIAVVAVSAAALLVAGGCQAKSQKGDLVAGKQEFVQKCGACHVLSRAGSKGITGPNLDEAFQRSIRDGFGRNVIRGIVERQILYPARSGVMPAKLFKDENAYDVASYVAYAAARKGKDTGALATAVGGGQKALVKAVGNSLDIDADPNGQLQFGAKAAEATAGKVTVKSKNASPTPHNIAVKGNGIDVKGAVGQGGHVSEITVDLKPGTYEFYCSVPGHEASGMKGTLTVK